MTCLDARTSALIVHFIVAPLDLAIVGIFSILFILVIYFILELMYRLMLRKSVANDIDVPGDSVVCLCILALKLWRWTSTNTHVSTRR